MINQHRFFLNIEHSFHYNTIGMSEFKGKEFKKGTEYIKEFSEKRLYKISNFIGSMSQANIDFLRN